MTDSASIESSTSPKSDLSSNLSFNMEHKYASTIADNEVLKYEIHRYSSFSTNFYPENILMDCPNDQTSRWSAHTNNPPQYLTLKLKRPAIVQYIKFGKFEKPHVCNIKKFRVFGGLEENNMVPIAEGGLKNDAIPEVFKLRSRTEDGSENLAILFLKIVPLLSWGPTFNFSIWYVELHGQDDPMYTSPCLKNYNKLREVEIIKLCLKHFRQQGYETAFKALQEQTKIDLEHKLINKLHTCLVVNGNFEKAENFVADCVKEGLMDEYLERQDYKHSWIMQDVESVEKPGTRGGHQLVMDTKKSVIYLYGGWDGFQDLSDLWMYNIMNNHWSLLYEHSEKFNGPSPRSCHKMIFDPVSENIFMLGRYLDNSIRTTDYIKSDFFLYDTRQQTWLQICDDTSQVGGPHLVYDHQMCIDADKRTIYIFGGKILTPRSVTNSTLNDPEYSGLFSYHIATNTWTQIFVDCHHPTASKPEVLSIKSRVTHCMVFHNKDRKLYIYGGQRGKEDMEDFVTYDVDAQVLSVINKNNFGCNEIRNEPPPGYTLRATIDSDRNEIYVFSSLSKLKDRRDMQQIDASNSFWVYCIKTMKWSRIYTYRHNICHITGVVKKEPNEPCPRYAHQMVYDDTVKLHYLFGGNPGKTSLPQLRLDDFWILSLEKPKREEILKHCRFLIRRLHYEEIARVDSFKAMQYLRNRISEVIDHSNEEQLNKFHKLASLIFTSNTKETGRVCMPALNQENDDQENISGEETNETTESNCNIDTSKSSSSNSDNESSKSVVVNLTNEPENSNKILNCRNANCRRDRPDFCHEIRTRRAFLFNKIVQLMPANMVQPTRNLSDFVVI
ncbi:muskelin [Teleopsis dalmanni]|uniref:muskelin n=1 Tax=Teleopsis dalmanni TaxID=139649 RepID=UPI0018CF3ACE|nr:muskelin [Teleopsis dalmanni]